MKLKGTGIDLGVVLLAFVLLTLPFVSFADAQKTRKKKSTKTATVNATKVQPITSDPIIVSRASDYQDPPATSAADPQAVSLPETERERQLADLAARIKALESGLKNGFDEKQKRLLLNLDILTRASSELSR
jgi:hypothetical protein